MLEIGLFYGSFNTKGAVKARIFLSKLKNLNFFENKRLLLESIIYLQEANGYKKETKASINKHDIYNAHTHRVGFFGLRI